jgi:hypothetical protein
MRRYDEPAVLVALVVVGLVQMAVHPRRTARLLAGGSWWD